jgi:hypothetical protein
VGIESLPRTPEKNQRLGIVLELSGILEVCTGTMGIMSSLIERDPPIQPLLQGGVVVGILGLISVISAARINKKEAI